MIKFFRKIRQQLLSENKFSKYLLYAIGEIVLVVIGILIALYINNANEQRKTEAKVDLILEELMDELGSNIKAVKKAGVFYKRKDSLTQLVLENKLSLEKYKESAFQFYSIVTTSNRISLTNNTYNKLLNISESIPEDFNQLMKNLYELNEKKLYIDYMDNRFNQTITEIIKHNTYAYEREALFDRNSLAQILYNSSKFKADVSYVSGVGNFEHFEKAFPYMQDAINCYLTIAELLNKPIDYELLGYTSSLSELLIGEWKTSQFPDAVAYIFKENEQIMVKNDVNPTLGKFYFLTDDKVVISPRRIYMTIKKEDDEITLHTSNGLIWKNK